MSAALWECRYIIGFALAVLALVCLADSIARERQAVLEEAAKPRRAWWRWR